MTEELSVIPQEEGISIPSGEALIAKAIEHGASVEALERLLAMREKLKAEQAREAYITAMAAFQAECPVIGKSQTAEIESKTGARYKYKFAPLDEIVTKTAVLRAKHGFNFRFDTVFEGNPPAQVVRCIVSHRAGHSEESSFRSPIDSGARMNVMQQSASALTYGKRYAYCNAFGIMTGDDDDGHGAAPKPQQSGWTPRAPVAAPGPSQGSTAASAPKPDGSKRMVRAVPGPHGHLVTVREEAPPPQDADAPLDEEAGELRAPTVDDLRGAIEAAMISRLGAKHPDWPEVDVTKTAFANLERAAQKKRGVAYKELRAEELQQLMAAIDRMMAEA